MHDDSTPASWRLRLHVSYDGSDFHGWQKQPHVSPTVQGTLEDTLTQIFATPVRVTGAGRTDAGVHAVEQIAHFDAPKDPHRYLLYNALQKMTPPAIAIKGLWLCPANFHALHSATHKTYRYVILNRPQPSALRSRYSWWQPTPIDINYLNDLSNLLLGTKDFSSFQTRGTKVPTTVRTIYQAEWRQPRPDILLFEITGNGFLKQMVRNIVGTLIDLHHQQMASAKLVEIINAHDRRMALSTAPPCGLHLYRVYYPQDLDNKCRKL